MRGALRSKSRASPGHSTHEARVWAQVKDVLLQCISFGRTHCLIYLM